MEETEVDVDEGLLSGVFLFSEDAKGWLTFGKTLESATALTPGEANFGSLVEGEFNLSSWSSVLGLFGDLFKDEPSMLDSILLQACVNIARGLTFESNSS